jgi:catechol 2,3-dioxygenase-like lactoylglutathione lyase family enzyme
MNDRFPTDDMALTHLLVVSDAQTSSRWYRDVLGAELYREYGTSVVLSFNGNWLLLVEAGGPTADKPGLSFVPPTPESVTHSFTIRVQDCRQSYDTLRERGARFLSPPHDWGSEIRCFFPDPDGHLWEISQLVD